MDPGLEVEPRLRAWAEAELGDPTLGGWTWTRLSSPTPGAPVVAGLARRGEDAGPREAAWVVKQHRAHRGFVQERDALRGWVPSGELGGAWVPRVRASNVELRAILLNRLPGSPVTSPADLDVHRAAGRFLAALHGLERPDPDRVPLADAIMRRLEGWRRRARLSAGESAIVDAHAPRPAWFEGVPRVPCHRDFSPRNWLWTGTTLGVVDFEHARLDLAHADLSKLAVDCWASEPGSREAFLAGYGRPLTGLDLLRLRACVVLHGLASLAWGQERGVVEHVDEGARALDLAARGFE